MRIHPFQSSISKNCKLITFGRVLLVLVAYTLIAIPAIGEEPEMVSQVGHSDAIRALAFSPNGLFLASGSSDNTAKLWDLESGQLLHTFEAHNESVSSVGFSADGKKLATGGWDKRVRLWDVATGRVLETIETNAVVRQLEFSKDGRFLAFCTNMVVDSKANKIVQDGLVYIWDLTKRDFRRVLQASMGHVNAIAFSPDSHFIAAGDSDGKVILWSVDSGQTLQTLPGPRVEVLRIAFSPNSAILAVGYWVAQVYLWDISTSTPKQLRPLKFPPPIIQHKPISPGKETKPDKPDFINSLTFFPDGKTLVSGQEDGTVITWRLNDGALLKKVERGSIIAFSPDRKFLASGSENGEVSLWRHSDDRPQKIMETRTSKVLSLAISPDDKIIVAGSGDGKIRIWEKLGGDLSRTIHAHRWPIASVHFSQSGQTLASFSNQTDQFVKFWDLRNDNLVKQISDDFFLQDIALSSTGEILATARNTKLVDLQRYGWDYRKIDSASRKVGFIRLWDIAKGEVLKEFEAGSSAYVLAFDPEGKTLAVGAEMDQVSGSGSAPVIILKDITSGKTLDVLAGHVDRISSLTYSRDGKILVSGSWDSTVRLWFLKAAKTFKTLKAQPSRVLAVALSPDGGQLAVGHYDGKINLWDIGSPTIQNPKSYQAHHSQITALKFSQDSKFLISGSHDGTIKIWDVPNGRLLMTGSVLGEKDWLVFTPDGFFDGTRRAWQLTPFRFSSEPLKLYEPEQFFNQFFQPGLLSDVFREGKPMREILRDRKDPRAFLDISKYRDSKLPEIKILSPLEASKTEKRQIEVIIEAKDTGSGLRDLRVFQNQTLVHFEHEDLKPDPRTMTYRLTVPVNAVAGENEISAYAFNRDNIKSKDATVTIVGADTLKRKGTAYILAVGINNYVNAGFNLRYAAADAKAITENLGQSLEALKDTHARVIKSELLNAHATKANIMAALHLLSGKRTQPPEKGPDDLRKLKVAEPEDALIVYFAGHGMAEGDRYFLLPHDLGYTGDPNQMKEEERKILLDSSISDRDLEAGFEKIKAGNIMLIIDACQSGQALEAEEKRRGPMNSRGLAQLAYEKGMYILAAAQSHQAALELERLGHGLLTYVLVEEGLNKMAADTNKDGRLTAREWLDYPVLGLTHETEQANQRLIARKGARAVKRVEGGVTGQAPRVYYRRELEGKPWIVAGEGRVR